jgi:hypothetical protein
VTSGRHSGNEPFVHPAHRGAVPTVIRRLRNAIREAFAPPPVLVPIPVRARYRRR